jgi:hypothetical protein
MILAWKSPKMAIINFCNEFNQYYNKQYCIYLGDLGLILKLNIENTNE